jgi:predicted MFS family arabinose efflux permease/predicted transcriptional regulator
MQQLAESDGQAAHIDARPSRRRKTLARRKVTVRLSERVSGRLDVAADRPGVGKSMLVEAALEQFMSPAPTVEAVLRDQLDHVHARFDHLERDMRMIAETVALHARYHLTVVPPLPESRQSDAVILGDERFKILAEQVDRRVRLGRPLMQETIDRLHPAEREKSGPAADEGSTHDLGADRNEPRPVSESGGLDQTPAAPAGTANDLPIFLQRPNLASGQNRPASHIDQNPAVAESSDPAPSKEKARAVQELPFSTWRLIFSVFLPFAAGYYLSFLFRTINASISPALASEFGLGAAETGLLASVYFLVFAGAQIPIGVLLDRYGPRQVQGVLLVLAVGGTSLFGNADSFAELLIGRSLIGLGVAASLMAGLKAIVMWFPRDRVALVNGGMIMLGSLGALTATAPTDWLLAWIGWRNLFGVLTILTVSVAALIYFVTPKAGGSPRHAISSGKLRSLRSIFADPRFLRIAPLSATCIGSSWAMHSLWAASWLSDVDGLSRQTVINQLFAMAIGISIGALLLGTMADRLRKRGITTEALLVTVGTLFMLAELAIVLRVPLPPIAPWSVVSVVGAGTVLSYAIIADYFPVEIAARANGALNLLHFGCAFVIQYGIGLIVNLWVPEGGHYPLVAYQVAFGLTLSLQAGALAWFAVPWIGRILLPPSSATPDDELAFARPAAEGLILESSQGIDW